MKAIFYTNACIEIITSKRRILCDPWLVDGAYGTWVHSPPLKAKPEDFTEYTDIYISHIHEDHFCRKSLKRLPKKVPVHLYKQENGALKRAVESLGFPVVEHEPWTWEDDLLFIAREVLPWQIQDTAMVVRDGNETIFNSNDELYSYGDCEKLAEMCGGKIDIAFMPYSGASDFPSCMREMQDHEKMEFAVTKERSHVEVLVATVQRLKPKMVVPFSGAYQFSAPYEAKNKYLGMFSPDDAAKVLIANGIPAKGMKEGETIYVASELERLTTARHHMWEKQQKHNAVIDYDLGLVVDGTVYTIPMSRDTVEQRLPKAPHTTLYLTREIFNRCLDREFHWNSAQLGGHVDFTADPMETSRAPTLMLYYLTV